jgi:hypothetical protein
MVMLEPSSENPLNMEAYSYYMSNTRDKVFEQLVHKSIVGGCLISGIAFYSTCISMEDSKSSGVSSNNSATGRVLGGCNISSPSKEYSNSGFMDTCSPDSSISKISFGFSSKRSEKGQKSIATDSPRNSNYICSSTATACINSNLEYLSSSRANTSVDQTVVTSFFNSASTVTGTQPPTAHSQNQNQRSQQPFVSPNSRKKRAYMDIENEYTSLTDSSSAPRSASMANMFQTGAGAGAGAGTEGKGFLVSPSGPSLLSYDNNRPGPATGEVGRGVGGIIIPPLLPNLVRQSSLEEWNQHIASACSQLSIGGTAAVARSGGGGGEGGGSIINDSVGGDASLSAHKRMKTTSAGDNFQ